MWFRDDDTNRETIDECAGLRNWSDKKNHGSEESGADKRRMDVLRVEVGVKEIVMKTLVRIILK